MCSPTVVAVHLAMPSRQHQMCTASLTAPFQKPLGRVPSCRGCAPCGCLRGKPVTGGGAESKCTACATSRGALVFVPGPPYCHRLAVSARVKTAALRPGLRAVLLRPPRSCRQGQQPGSCECAVTAWSCVSMGGWPKQYPTRQLLKYII
jgi:hypothetical protein